MPMQSAGMQPEISRTRWELGQGGTLNAEAAPVQNHRASIALQRLADTDSRLSVHILDSHDPVAFSFPDGSIYLSVSLVDRLSDDQLCGAIAHEMGHLLRDGILRTPEALRGIDANMDVERAADLLGRQVLQSRGIPMAALTEALEKVADDSRGTIYYAAIAQRVRLLQSMDAATP